MTKLVNRSLKACTVALLCISLLLTFTISDYYIFNRIGEFGFLFVFSQWIKKSGLLLLALAVFYNKKCCSDIAKYILPPAVLLSAFTFGSFFDITKLTPESTGAELCFASINEFIPKWLNVTAFFLSCALYLAICALLFVRDGCKADKRSFVFLPSAIIATMPLNIFENFFDISDFSREHFLWFGNFTIWHVLALAGLAGGTVGAYFFLKNKHKRLQEDYLAAMAIVLLIQCHSKDSMLLGDGYNVYSYVFSAIPLFICNIGMYVASLSVFCKKRVLYSICFFVHAVGALSVFLYFGKKDMSNYGIIFSYSILYFCLTHSILFILSVLPSALGHYRFTVKDCIIPLIYYFAVIVVATVASGLVSSFLEGYTYGGYTLSYANGDFGLPNYAFTQVNPFPVELPVVPLRIWKWEMNLLYIVILYIFYVLMFWSFNGLYQAYLCGYAKFKARPQATVIAETAVSDDEKTE